MGIAAGAVMLVWSAASLEAPSAGALVPLVRAPQLGAPRVPAGWVPSGAVPSSQPVTIRVVLAPSNQSALGQLLAALLDPSSPEYHRWLAPGQFGRLFGPSPSTVASVEGWLRGRGMSNVAFSGFAVAASAPAATTATALGTRFERYRSPKGHLGFSATTAPLVPQDLASGAVQAILGLSTVTRLEPALARGHVSPALAVQPATARPAYDGLAACQAAQSAAAPGYYTLDQLGAAYGIGSLLFSGQNGHGETVGLYELGQSSVSDVQTYKSCFRLTNPVSVDEIDVGATPDSGGTEEADADIEQVATQAPGASIISYEGPNSGTGPYDVWDAIVSQDVARVVSTSWGLCEYDSNIAGYLNAFEPLFEQAVAQGQTILAASGDSGSEDCYRSDGSTALQVDYPASSAYVTGVGGTTLYAPGDEPVWNQCEDQTGTSCAVEGGGAGGGGISQYVAGPSWQPAEWYWPSGANPCGTHCREVPDVSANAGAGMVIYDASAGGWSVVGGTSLAAPLIAGLVADRNDGCTTATGDFAPMLYSAASQGLYGTGLTDITSGDNDLTRTNGGLYPASSGYDPASGLGSPEAAGLSCPEVFSISPNPAAAGSTVTVSGLGLEHAAIGFGGVAARVQSASATQSIVTVPSGTGTVAVTASSRLGTGTTHPSFSFRTPRRPTTTALVSLPDPSGAGKAVALRATVAPQSGGGPTPTGTVRFDVEGSTASGCAATAMNTGAATCVARFPGAGATYMVTATYSGDANYQASISAALRQTTLPASRTLLRSSKNPSATGKRVVFVAVVRPVVRGTMPTGTVHFIIRAQPGAPCATVKLKTGGRARCAVALRPGIHRVIAVYRGGAVYSGSRSKKLMERVRHAERAAARSTW